MSDIKSIKILLAGNINVGKSTLYTVFNTGKGIKGDSSKGSKAEKPQEKAEKAKLKVLTVKKDKVIVNLVDTCGEERFRTLSSSYYNSVDGVLVAFDLTDRTSFEDAQRWLDEVEFLATEKSLHKMLVGTKADKNRVVTTGEAEELAQRMQIPYFEVTATKRKTIVNALSIFGEFILHGNVYSISTVSSSSCVCQ